MPDFLHHRHLDREKGDVTGTQSEKITLLAAPFGCENRRSGSDLFSFPGLPAGEDVFLAQLTLVAHFREHQHVAVASEFVSCLSPARFRSVRPVRFLNRHRIAGRCVFAPHIHAVAFSQTDLECAVRFERPDRA